MIQKPRLKTFLTLYPLSETTWGVRGGSDEAWKLKLRDERAIRTLMGMIPWLTGVYGTAELLERVEREGVDREAAQELLERLRESQLLEDADPHGLSAEEQERHAHQIAWFSRYTSEGGARHQAALRAAHVGVVGDGALAEIARRQLEETGFGTVTLRARNAFLEMNGESFAGADAPPRAVLVAQSAHDPRLMSAMDELSKRDNLPWLLVRALSPREGWVGPLFVPGDTADYLSLEARLRGNLPYFHEQEALADFLRARDAAAPPQGGLRACHEVLIGIAVAELVRLVTGIAVPHLAGRFLTIDYGSWETEAHDVLRVPRLDFAAQRPVASPWKEVSYGDKDRDDMLSRRA